jgi:hypothetical protein
MILPLFIAILALAVIIIWLGYYTDDEPYLPVGLFFFFLLGVIILNGNLEYQTGDTKNITLSYTNGTLTSQQEISAYNYTSWNDTNSHWIGWTMTILSACGFALSLINMRRGRGDDYVD